MFCAIEAWLETLMEWYLGKSDTNRRSSIEFLITTWLSSFTYQIVVGCANILRVVLWCRRWDSLLWNAVRWMTMLGWRDAESRPECFIRRAGYLVDPKWTHELIYFSEKPKESVDSCNKTTCVDIQVFPLRRTFGKVERLISFLKSRSKCLIWSENHYDDNSFQLTLKDRFASLF